MAPFKLFILTVMIQGAAARDHKLVVEPFENPCYATEKGLSGVSIIDREQNIKIVTRARCVQDGEPIPDLMFDPREIPPDLLPPPRPPVVRKGYQDYAPRPCEGDPILDMLPNHCRK